MATSSKATSGKSGFEIRLEVLQMAKDFMDKQAKLNADFAAQAFDVAVRANQATVDQWKEYTPATYTIEDMMAKANELYKFIAPSTK